MAGVCLALILKCFSPSGYFNTFTFISNYFVILFCFMYPMFVSQFLRNYLLFSYSTLEIIYYIVLELNFEILKCILR